MQLRLVLFQKLLKSKYSNLARYWFDLAKMETAGFTSPLFLNANNPWGMKLPEKRPTTSEPRGYEGRQSDASRNNTSLFDAFVKPGAFWNKAAGDVVPTTWAKYATLDYAVDDIILWMDYTNFPTASPTLLTFVQELKKRGYFGSENVDSYFKKIEAWQVK